MPSKARKTPVRLPEKLLAIRKRFGLSQNEILIKLNAGPEINRGKISEYERGKRVPPLYIILAYARAAGTSMEVLVDDELEFSDDVRK
ncbi:MAG: helix-turn-helix transcriptional regulator [Pyrinomonadaceae bacterium]